MININDKNNLDDLFLRIGSKLQLDPTRIKRAEDSYNAIGDILKEAEDLTEGKDSIIYPQGSFAIGTTVKPVNDSEYDLDFVFRINKIWNAGMSEEEVLKKLQNILESNGNYKGKVEPKNRCVRINYAGDFHLDILPAYPYMSLDSEMLKIPDREMHSWVDTSPKLYAEWFNKKADDFKRIALFEQRCDVEDLPDIEPYPYKSPLKVAVQLVKRAKSIYYEKKEDLEVPSIIITTMMADCYNYTNSEYEAIMNFIHYFEQELKNNNGVLLVKNPNNPHEKFTDKFKSNPNMQEECEKFVAHLKKELIKIKTTDGGERYKLLYRLFGENVVVEAIKEQAIVVRERKGNSKITASSTNKVAPNTFYGG